jgi:hypothetical protein
MRIYRRRGPRGRRETLWVVWCGVVWCGDVGGECLGALKRMVSGQSAIVRVPEYGGSVVGYLAVWS